MPSRVLRGEIVDSESLSAVSMEAELTFDRLILAVDDFGRFDARPARLKAALYPMREAVTPKRVIRWVEELAAGESPPVQLYEIDGRPYLVLTGWEKHRGKGRRAETSKYPEMLVPGIPRKSADCHADPPGKREAGSVGREARSVGRASSNEAPGSPAARAIALWPMLMSTANSRGGKWAEVPGKNQLKIVAGALADYTEDQLILAIKGAVERYGAKRDDFDPSKYITASTIFRPSHIDANIEQGQPQRRLVHPTYSLGVK